MNTYFTSDSHYHHRNIVRGTSSWDKMDEGGSHQSTRDFDTLEEHDDAIVTGINAVVKAGDTLWHLGDWSFGGYEQIKIFRDRLNCKNINLIFGNHDQHIEPMNSRFRQLFQSCQYYKELSFSAPQKWGQVHRVKICLFHYAMRVFNQAHHGALHLYGHSHNTLPDIGNRSMDVGMDTNNLTPYHLEEIYDKLLYRSFSPVDHHTENTN